MHKLTTKDKQLEVKGKNPYQELEAAYVAQICLTWEALSWNYKNFIRSKASQGEEDSGCQAQIAQEFQQFQVLLQRYIENEPYEHGHRPEVYARMRNCSPKLLQVPEFQGTKTIKYLTLTSWVFHTRRFLGISHLGLGLSDHGPHM